MAIVVQKTAPRQARHGLFFCTSHMSLGERLREERERLGLNQTDMAALSGASKRSQIDWEKGVAVPNAAYLTAIAAAGADVTYVLFDWRPPETMREHLRRAAQITLTAGSNDEARARMQALFVDSLPKVALPAPYGTPDNMVVLTAEERALVNSYRGASKEGRKAIRATAGALTKVPGRDAELEAIRAIGDVQVTLDRTPVRKRGAV